MTPVVFEPTQQKRSHDCAVACLKMLLGVDYTTATNAFPKRAKVATEGAGDRQIINAARRLGFKLRFVKDGDLSEVVGILQVIDNETKDVHVVMVFGGSIYNPGDHTIWTDIAAFLEGRYSVGGVFVLEDE